MVKNACPTPRGWLRNRRTGRINPAPCRKAACPSCGAIEAWWKARIISDGGAAGPPERYVVLTLPEAQWDMPWPTLRQKKRDFKRYLARRGFDGYEDAWTVERGKRGNLHINSIQRGPYVPQRVLQETWGGIVHVRKIKADGHDALARYAVKEARKVSGYALKEAGRGLEEHLTLNGGRLVHLSRGYLGGERQDDVRMRLADPGGEWEWIAELPRSALDGRRLAAVAIRRGASS